jgi:hypothetical protein
MFKPVLAIILPSTGGRLDVWIERVFAVPMSQMGSKAERLEANKSRPLCARKRTSELRIYKYTP